MDRLGLSGCSLAGRVLKSLALRRFRALDLHNNALGVRGAQYALTSAPTLVELDLSNAGIGDPKAAAIAGTALPVIERLSVQLNRLTHRSFAALAKATAPNPRVLDLANTQPGQAGVEALGAAKLPALRELDLSNCLRQARADRRHGDRVRGEPADQAARLDRSRPQRDRPRRSALTRVGSCQRCDFSTSARRRRVTKSPR